MLYQLICTYLFKLNIILKRKFNLKLLTKCFEYYILYYYIYKIYNSYDYNKNKSSVVLG